MRLSLPLHDLAAYTARQLDAFFPDGRTVDMPEFTGHVRDTLDRVAYCFERINRPGYFVDGQAAFDHLHGDQVCTYLYFLANTIYRAGGDEAVCQKVYLLNKALNGFNCLYDVELPDIFCVVHGLGTVLGRAQYRNYLVVCHNTTIGAIGGVFPTMSEKLILSAGASLIGESVIGSNVLLEPNCSLVKTNVEANTRVAGTGPYTFKPNTARPIEYYFRLATDDDSATTSAVAKETK